MFPPKYKEMRKKEFSYCGETFFSQVLSRFNVIISLAKILLQFNPRKLIECSKIFWPIKIQLLSWMYYPPFQISVLIVEFFNNSCFKSAHIV